MPLFRLNHIYNMYNVDIGQGKHTFIDVINLLVPREEFIDLAKSVMVPGYVLLRTTFYSSVTMSSRPL